MNAQEVVVVVPGLSNVPARHRRRRWRRYRMPYPSLPGIARPCCVREPQTRVDAKWRRCRDSGIGEADGLPAGRLQALQQFVS